ncbi:MAG: methyltransferase domain-containing protein [Candidatus Peribacteraceae bacterium]|nr:methyltransferase domain-containing protein [Candidatus Peribacteraceae bacterium]
MSFAEAASFLASYIRHPRVVSSVIPTSKTSARAIAALVAARAGLVVVEYGPGSGPVSAAVLERLGPDGRLILIEMTPALAAGLSRRFAHDARVDVVEGDAVDVEAILAARGLTHADYVLCSIPLSLIDPPVRERILTATAQLLGPQGRFIVFLFRPKATASHLAPHFPRTAPPRLLPWNIPPLWLFDGRI